MRNECCRSILFQTLPGMISYSDRLGVLAIAVWDSFSFKPFQGWFPILTAWWCAALSALSCVSNPSRDDFLFWRPERQAWRVCSISFQTLPGMISYSDEDEYWTCAIVVIQSFKPFQGWFPILTRVYSDCKRMRSVRFQTLPGMISYSDPFKVSYLYRKVEVVSNPSRDDFLFWPISDSSVEGGKMVKFQTLPGMISYSDKQLAIVAK